MGSRTTSALLATVSLIAASAVSAVAQTPPPPAAGAPPAPRPPAPPARFLAWVPKPTTLTPYTAPMKPHTKLSEVLAKHRGQASWREPVVEDNLVVAEYVQMAPGEKTKTQMLADHRFGFIVWDGQLKVSIEGQEPFVASKGFMVQVPFRVAYTLETVGDKPALRFEAKPRGAVTLYAASETPPPAPAGQAWTQMNVDGGKDTYDRQTGKQPYLDYFKELTASPRGPRGTFVGDDRIFFNIIRGRGMPRPADTVKGHFHANYGEFWFLMEGQTSYQIEGVPFFVAEPGDVVYAPAGRWHRASFAGDGMSARIPINPFPFGAHFYDPKEGAN